MNSRQNQNSLIPIHRGQMNWPSCQKGWGPVLYTHLTAPSLQAAATSGPRPGRSSSHTARDMYLQEQQTDVTRSLAAAAQGSPRTPTPPVWLSASPGLRVHLDHPVPVALPVPVLV